MGLLRLILRALFPKPKPVYRPNPHSQIGRVHHKQPQDPKRGQITIDPLPVPAVVGRCWVIDGDTIDIEGTRIRLAGIDAPEIEDPYCIKAKIALVQLCKGQRIRAEFDEQQSYERLVATCYLPDGRDLSAEMVKAGMAIDWPKFSRGKYRDLEVEGIRKKLWRCDARQRGRMPASLPD